MKTKLILSFLIALGLGAACGYYYKTLDTDFREAMKKKTPEFLVSEIQAEIQATLSRQDAAWNRGDIDAFMDDYIKSEMLRFASGGSVKYGWQATIDGYKARYSTAAKMGQLSFTDLDIQVIDADDALVFGRWKLTRESDMPNGLFTLHMRKIDGSWVIVSDHTSSAE